MCCVGTKNLLADYRYVIHRFLAAGATSPERAVPYAALGIDCAEHLFARDNFQSMLRCGDISRGGAGYYLRRNRLDTPGEDVLSPSTCPLT